MADGAHVLRGPIFSQLGPGSLLRVQPVAMETFVPAWGCRQWYEWWEESAEEARVQLQYTGNECTSKAPGPPSEKTF